MSGEKNEFEEKKEGVQSTDLSIATPGDIFSLIDTDELIESLKQRITGDWIYEFPMGDKKVRGIGADGASEIATFISYKSKGQFVIRTISIQNRKEYQDKCEAEVLAGIYALAVINGKIESALLNTAVGFASQDKIKMKKSGDEFPVVSPMTQAVSKAQRNAFNRLIPSKIREVVIEVAIKLGRVRETEEEVENGDSEGATSKQIAYIKNLLKSSKITDDERKLFEEDLGTLSKKEAGKRIVLLQSKTSGDKNKDHKDTGGPQGGFFK